MAKVGKKDFTDVFDPSVLGDPSNYGGMPDFPPLDTSSDGFINGGFDANGQDAFGLTPDDYAQLGAYNAGLDAGGPNLSGLLSGGSQGASLLQRLFGGNGSTGSSLAGLLPMLLAGAGGYLNHNATQQATQQTVNGINNTNAQISQILGGAQAGYQPYMQAGQSALSKLSAMGPSNLAGNFKPLGSGRGLSLASIAKGQ